MIKYTTENCTILSIAKQKGEEAAKLKHKSKHFNLEVFRFNVKDNPYTVTGSMGKRLKAAWHNGFRAIRNK